MRPRLLDLFCGGGGAARGYQMAGFHVTGVDIEPQPRYAGDEFILADAMTFPLEGWDAIHASPPCQRFSVGTPDRSRHPDLIAPLRRRLEESGLPWVIENVRGAPIRPDIRLCGCMVGLPRIRRVRHFETNWRPPLEWTKPCSHYEVVTVTGHGTTSGNRASLGRNVGIAEMREVMGGIDWMTRDELSQAIPPAYTQFIGEALMRSLVGSRP